MPVRTNGGVFSDQMLTGSLSHWVVTGADFSGAIDQYGQPVPFSAAEIIFKNIEASAYINIMNPNENNLSFALEEGRSTWTEESLQEMIRGLGTNVGVDHLNLSNVVVQQVPYNFAAGNVPGSTSFIPISPGEELTISNQYFVTAAGTITLPALSTAMTPGQAIRITKKVDIIVFVNVGEPSDIINTDLGPTDSIEFDATQELVFVVSDDNHWELQIGAVP